MMRGMTEPEAESFEGRTVADVGADVTTGPNAHVIFGTIEDAGVPYYDRKRDLYRAGLPLFDAELEDNSIEGIEFVIRKLEERCAAERRRAMMGHWSYDLNRHLALRIALKAEKLALVRRRTELGVPQIMGEM